MSLPWFIIGFICLMLNPWAVLNFRSVSPPIVYLRLESNASLWACTWLLEFYSLSSGEWLAGWASCNWLLRPWLTYWNVLLAIVSNKTWFIPCIYCRLASLIRGDTNAFVWFTEWKWFRWEAQLESVICIEGWFLEPSGGEAKVGACSSIGDLSTISRL